MKDALVVVGGVFLPDTPPVRKDADKMHGGAVLIPSRAALIPSRAALIPSRAALIPSVPFSGVPLIPFVHFTGVPCSSVHFSGVFAAAIEIELLLVHLGARALESPHHRPNALRERFQHLDYQVHMVRHHHLRQHFQCIAFPLVELRQSAEHLTHPPPVSVEPYRRRFSTLALECSKQRITPLHRQREVIDGTPPVVPSLFTMVPHRIHRSPLPLSLVFCHMIAFFGIYDINSPLYSRPCF